MNRFRIVSLLLAFLFAIALMLMCGCTKGGGSGENFDIVIGGEPQDVEEPKEPEAPEESDGTDEEESAGMDAAADFPEEFFPRGTWTVNEFKKKYGDNVQIRNANIIDDSQEVWVSLVYENMEVTLVSFDPSQFSFYGVPIEINEGYELSDSDMGLKLEVWWQRIKGPGYPLPYDLVPGKSTKAEIISAYPEGALIIGKHDIGPLTYYYDDDIGDVPYCVFYVMDDFDTNVLKVFNVKWFE